MLIRCPYCDCYTQHQHARKKVNPLEDTANYYLCTACLRRRRIGVDELAELLYQASRRVQTFLQEAM